MQFPYLELVVGPYIKAYKVINSIGIPGNDLLRVAYIIWVVEHIGMHNIAIGGLACGIPELGSKYPPVLCFVAQQKVDLVRLAESKIVLAQSIMVIALALHIGVAQLAVYLFSEPLGYIQVKTAAPARAGIGLFAIGHYRAGYHFIKCFIPCLGRKFQIWREVFFVTDYVLCYLFLFQLLILRLIGDLSKQGPGYRHQQQNSGYWFH